MFLAGCALPGLQREFLNDARQQPERAALVRGVPSFPPTRPDGEAGPLSAVLRFWTRRSLSPADVSRWYEERGAGVAPEERPAVYARAWGLWAFLTPGTTEKLTACLRAGVPVIVPLQEKPFHRATLQYVVVTGYSDLSKRFLALTGTGAAAFPYDEFMRLWRANLYRMLVVCPPDQAGCRLGPEELASRARFHEARGAFREALRDYRTALETRPGDAALLTCVGNAQRELAETNEAERSYREAIAADPHAARAYNNLAYLLAEGGHRPDEAVALARQALVLDPANPLFMDTLGIALARRGDYAEAADILERARARAGWYPAAVQIEIALHLAMAHLNGGHEHLARQVVQDILGMDPGAALPPELQPLAPERR